MLGRKLTGVRYYLHQAAILHVLEQLDELAKLAFYMAFPVGEVSAIASHDRQLQEGFVA